jgi:hypothetical protein
MRPAAIVLALTSLQVLAALPAAPSETWAWFRTVSTGTDWWITEGKGDVNFSGSRFKATLRDAENPEDTRLLLQGSVSGRFVKAPVKVVESDTPVFEVSGRLKRLCWPIGGGRDILILTNGRDVVGLVKELGPSMSCKPAT